MLLGIPIVIIFLPLTYLLITKILYPIHVGKTSGSDEIIQTEIKSLGKMSLPEVVVSLIELVMASLWIFRPLLQSADWSQNIDAIQSLSDEGIAIIGATLLFAAPISLRKSQFLIDWSDTKELPWGILILFGGGLALAKSFQDTGLTTTIGSLSQHISDIPISLFVFVICAIMIFLTELTSNTATTASFLPVLGAMAVGMGEDPALLTIPVAIVASCAFMLPVATPPNAVVFASGKISLPQMAKTGLWLNILSVVLIPSIFLLLYSLIF
jgi:sodium-dependent dicarboxylate transporter 2/3/5